MAIEMYISRMTKNVSVAEARNELTGLLREVEKGNEIEITRRGKPVAVLVSCAELDRLRGKKKPQNFAEALRKWRKTLPKGFKGFTKKEVDSWRDRSPSRVPPGFE